MKDNNFLWVCDFLQKNFPALEKQVETDFHYERRRLYAIIHGHENHFQGSKIIMSKRKQDEKDRVPDNGASVDDESSGDEVRPLQPDFTR
jgi:hypothetical protein